MVGTMECWNIEMLELDPVRVFKSHNFSHFSHFSTIPLFHFSNIPLSSAQWVQFKATLLRGWTFTDLLILSQY